MTVPQQNALVAAALAAACLIGGVAQGRGQAIAAGVGFIAVIPTTLNPPPDRD
jgi:hypothetical protein